MTTPTIRRPASPSPETVPTPALKPAGADMSRCLSTASLLSHGSATTRDSRDSLGSDTTTSTSSALSRQSSGSYSTSASSSALAAGMTTPFPAFPTDGTATSASLASLASLTSSASSGSHLAKRRGYMRPQGTDFAASARSRESVLSLGSITHLQHYFARTGLLDLKGQLERRRRGAGAGKARTLDLSQLDPATYLQPPPSKAPRAVSMGSMASLTASSPRLSYAATSSILSDAGENGVVESPTEDLRDLDYDPYAYTRGDGGDNDQDGLDGHYGDGGDGGDNDDDGDWYVDENEEILPPTASTYMHREKPLPKPPSLAELRSDLTTSLDSASASLVEARKHKIATTLPSPTDSSITVSTPVSSPTRHAHSPSVASTTSSRAATASWYEIQGMHLLDVMTLAIRAAKVYYTAHEHPDRLDAIKPERVVRSELLGVMDVLRRMATRNFAGGVRSDELRALEAWIASLRAMLDAEEAMAAAERAERADWTWLRDADWPAGPDAEDRTRAYAREFAFMQSMLAKGEPTPAVAAATAATTGPVVPVATDLPPWTPMDRSVLVSAEAEVPGEAKGGEAEGETRETGETAAPTHATPFLRHLQSGVLLVQLHNCAVSCSRRRFGAIPSFHADTQKPYRAADNLRYWVKAAELRWEVQLKIDALGIVYNSSPAVWADFEDAVYRWCRQVRAEITADIKDN